MKTHAGSVCAILALIIGLTGFPAAGAEYPAKPVSLICPFPAGGSRDIIGRIFASSAEKYLGRPLVVINKPGASGTIGMVAAIQAPPDGHTLALISTSDVNVIQAAIANGRKPAFTREDFMVLGSLTRSPVQVVVPYGSPWQTLADIIRDLKAKPDHYTYCSGGMYNVIHIATERLLRATGTSARLVPYKGAGDCIPAVVGRQIDFTTQFLSSTTSLVRGGRLRVLAVMGEERTSPEVPTTRELGIDVQVYQMIGLAAPKGTPVGVVEKLREVIKRVAADLDFIKAVEATGDTVRYTSAGEFTEYWDNDAARLARLFKVLIEPPAQ